MSTQPQDVGLKVKLDKQQDSAIEHPDDHYCPITYEVMSDPVVAADGYSYERGAIAEWLSRNWTSPKTNKNMSSSLVPNITLKIIIRDFQEKAEKAKKKTDEENENYLESEKLKFAAAQAEALRKQQLALAQQHSTDLQQAFRQHQASSEQDLQSAVTVHKTENRNLQEINNRLQAQLNEMRLELAAAKQRNQVLEQQLRTNVINKPACPAVSHIKEAAEPNAYHLYTPAITPAFSSSLSAAAASHASSSRLPQALSPSLYNDGELDALDLLNLEAHPAVATSVEVTL